MEKRAFWDEKKEMNRDQKLRQKWRHHAWMRGEREGNCHASSSSSQAEEVNFTVTAEDGRCQGGGTDSPRLLFSFMLFSCSCSSRTVNSSEKQQEQRGVDERRVCARVCSHTALVNLSKSAELEGGTLCVCVCVFSTLQRSQPLVGEVVVGLQGFDASLKNLLFLLHLLDPQLQLPLLLCSPLGQLLLPALCSLHAHQHDKGEY